jgi:short-subunit dehydrogenase
VCLVDAPMDAAGDTQFLRWLAGGPSIELASELACELVWRAGAIYRSSWQPVELAAATRPPFRKRGSYAIVGGAGSVGFDMSMHLATHYQARIAWIGRRPLDEEIRGRMERLRSAGGEAIYIRADATRADQIEKAMEQIGPLHGVVQAALVLHTRALSRLTEVELREVLAPKLQGTENLFRAVSRRPLDFLLLCSSIQSFTADPRQAAYAAACTFLDAFADAAAERAPFPVKVVNLGYWGGGALDTPAMRRHVESLGFRTLDPAAGMEAIARLLAGPERQIAVMDRVESGSDGPETVCDKNVGRTSWSARDVLVPPKPTWRSAADQEVRPTSQAGVQLGLI